MYTLHIKTAVHKPKNARLILFKMPVHAKGLSQAKKEATHHFKRMDDLMIWNPNLPEPDRLDLVETYFVRDRFGKKTNKKKTRIMAVKYPFEDNVWIDYE